MKKISNILKWLQTSISSCRTAICKAYCGILTKLQKKRNQKSYEALLKWLQIGFFIILIIAIITGVIVGCYSDDEVTPKTENKNPVIKKTDTSQMNTIEGDTISNEAATFIQNTLKSPVKKHK